MTKEIEKLSQLRTELIKLIDDFPVDKRLEILFDKWSLKDVLAHLCGWDRLTADALTNLNQGKQSEWGKGVNEMNADNVAKRKERNWDEVYKEFINNSQDMINKYSSLADDLWDKPLYPNKKFSPAKFLKIDIDHYQEHIEAIKSKL